MSPAVADPPAARRRTPTKAVAEPIPIPSPPRSPLRPQDGPRRRYRMTRANYIEFQERQTDVKFQWVDGEAIEMAGGTEQHADIGGNFFALFKWALRGRVGKAYNSDLRIRTGAGPNRYADASAVLGESRFDSHPRDLRLDLLNPTVVVEVLSESTAEEDETGEKFADYTATPSVTDYVLADSRAMRVVHRTRTDPSAEWTRIELTAPDAVLSLPALGFAATLAEIYEGVALPPAATGG